MLPLTSRASLEDRKRSLRVRANGTRGRQVIEVVAVVLVFPFDFCTFEGDSVTFHVAPAVESATQDVTDFLNTIDTTEVDSHAVAVVVVVDAVSFTPCNKGTGGIVESSFTGIYGFASGRSSTLDGLLCLVECVGDKFAQLRTFEGDIAVCVFNEVVHSREGVVDSILVSSCCLGKVLRTHGTTV